MRRHCGILLTVLISSFLLSTSFEAAAHSLQIKAQMSPSKQHLKFSLPLGLPSMSVEVFSLKGERIFHGISDGHGIMWDLRDQYGRKVPNGIYFYRLTSVEYGGSYHWGKLKKFIVLR